MRLLGCQQVDRSLGWLLWPLMFRLRLMTNVSGQVKGCMKKLLLPFIPAENLKNPDLLVVNSKSFTTRFLVSRTSRVVQNLVVQIYMTGNCSKSHCNKSKICALLKELELFKTSCRANPHCSNLPYGNFVSKLSLKKSVIRLSIYPNGQQQFCIIKCSW